MLYFLLFSDLLLSAFFYVARDEVSVILPLVMKILKSNVVFISLGTMKETGLPIKGKGILIDYGWISCGIISPYAINLSLVFKKLLSKKHIQPKRLHIWKLKVLSYFLIYYISLIFSSIYVRN